jgi:hypothetical protein
MRMYYQMTVEEQQDEMYKEARSRPDFGEQDIEATIQNEELRYPLPLRSLIGFCASSPCSSSDCQQQQHRLD